MKTHQTKALMKKFTFSLIIAFIAFNIGVSTAQENGLPKHEISKEEQLNFANSHKVLPFSKATPVQPRNIAEWEPSEGVVIAYVSSYGGFGIPDAAIQDLAKTAKVYVACPSSYQSTVTSKFNTLSITNYSFINATTDSWWTRDFTGWFIADSSGTVSVVDFTYDRDRPNDDAFTPYEATALNNMTCYTMGLSQTGGNWMCDGYGIAASTDLVNDDNSSLSTTQIQTQVSTYLGISNYMIRPDALGDYIKHIDCWGKFLAPDKMLIDSVSTSDSRYSYYEAAASYFKSTNCAYGYHYKVYRPFIGSSTASSNTAVTPYSNVLILNNRVFIPIVGSTTTVTKDSAALKLYRKAMPGYIVKGYKTSTSGTYVPWFNTDALHCRTHEIADRQMLYIQHYPLYGKINSSTGYDINAVVYSYAKNALATNYPMVKYKVHYNGTWDSIPMSFVSYRHYKANIPTQNSGDTIYYYIKAKDVTGKIAYHPFIGQPDPYYFIADGTTVLTPEIIVDPQMSFFTYPNPSKGEFFLFLKSNYSDNASIQIFNIDGKLVYTDNMDFEIGDNNKFLNIGGIATGVYILQVKTKSNILTKQLLIQ